MRSLLVATAQRASRRWALPRSSSDCLVIAATRHGGTTKTPAATVSQFFSTTIANQDTTSALAKTSRDGVVGHPIDFDVSSKVEGNESQIVTITLEPGQVLRAEVRRPAHEEGQCLHGMFQYRL